MFAVLSRVEPPKDEMNLTTKMKLYDDQYVKGHKPIQVHDMRRECPREGMCGLSPRFVIDQINATIAAAAENNRDYVTALDVLRQLLLGVQNRDSFSKEEKARYEQFVDVARNEWNDLLRNDIQKAFFLSFEEEAKALCDNYLTQIEMALSDEKQRDPITGKEAELDEKLMESIEGHLEVSRSGVDDFRNEILRYFGNAARKGKRIDYTQHSQLREAIQKQLFEERQGTIRMTVSTRNPDPEGLRRMNDVIDRMVEQQGYTAASANELLKYATAHLFDK
jgi:serine protein kinase